MKKKKARKKPNLKNSFSWAQDRVLWVLLASALALFFLPMVPELGALDRARGQLDPSMVPRALWLSWLSSALDGLLGSSGAWIFSLVLLSLGTGLFLSWKQGFAGFWILSSMGFYLGLQGALEGGSWLVPGLWMVLALGFWKQERPLVSALALFLGLVEEPLILFSLPFFWLSEKKPRPVIIQSLALVLLGGAGILPWILGPEESAWAMGAGVWLDSLRPADALGPEAPERLEALAWSMGSLGAWVFLGALVWGLRSKSYKTCLGLALSWLGPWALLPLHPDLASLQRFSAYGLGLSLLSLGSFVHLSAHGYAKRKWLLPAGSLAGLALVLAPFQGHGDSASHNLSLGARVLDGVPQDGTLVLFSDPLSRAIRGARRLGLGPQPGTALGEMDPASQAALAMGQMSRKEACSSSGLTGRLYYFSGSLLDGGSPGTWLKADSQPPPRAPAIVPPMHRAYSAASAYIVLLALDPDRQRAEALAMIEKAGDLAGEDAGAWAMLASAWGALGENRRQADALIRCRTLNRGSLEYLLWSAEALDLAGEPLLSDAYLMEALEKAPSHPRVLQARGAYFARRGSPKARAFFEAAEAARQGLL